MPAGGARTLNRAELTLQIERQSAFASKAMQLVKSAIAEWPGRWQRLGGAGLVRRGVGSGPAELERLCGLLRVKIQRYGCRRGASPDLLRVAS